MYLMQHLGGLLNRPWSRALERHYAWLQRRRDRRCGLFQCDTPCQCGKLDRGKEKRWCPSPLLTRLFFFSRLCTASVSSKEYLEIERQVIYVYVCAETNIFVCKTHETGERYMSMSLTNSPHAATVAASPSSQNIDQISVIKVLSWIFEVTNYHVLFAVRGNNSLGKWKSHQQCKL